MSLAALFISASLALSLPPGLLDALCWTESEHRPHVVNRSDGVGASVGICQVKMKSARRFGFKGTEQELLKPEVNIEYAGRILQYQIRRYGDITRAICAYNKGHSSGDGRNEYTRKVLTAWRTRCPAGYKRREAYARGGSK